MHDMAAAALVALGSAPSAGHRPREPSTIKGLRLQNEGMLQGAPWMLKNSDGVSSLEKEPSVTG